MKLSKIILVICLCFYAPLYSYGQDGCLLPSKTLYTSYSSLLGVRMYYNSPSTPLSGGYCSWEASSTVSCNVCMGSINVLSLLCIGGPVVSGERGNYQMIPCSIDEYASIFTLIAAGAGAYYIYRKKIYVKA
ncbi:MAG: hypothetical protein EOO90_29535 [Pedobacter sp.]|nr:MAG: hypothetical protein EOO90_29535 [Pedobacter sp.]